jgi:hypothetical protein
VFADFDAKTRKIPSQDDRSLLAVQVLTLSPKAQAVLFLLGQLPKAEDAVENGSKRTGGEVAILAVLASAGSKVLDESSIDLPASNIALSLESVDLGEAIPAIAVSEEAEEGDGFMHRTETLHLYRFVDGKLNPVFEHKINDERDDPECSGDAERTELRYSDKRHAGLKDIIAITRRFKSTLTMKRRDMICVPSEEKDKTTYHFDGASYTE